MIRWTSSDIPRQNGHTAVITGTGGLGYKDALLLTRADGDIILARHKAGKGADAIDRIRRRVPAATSDSISRTLHRDLIHNGPRPWSVHGPARLVLPFLCQPAAEDALPTLLAASADRTKAGDY